MSRLALLTLLLWLFPGAVRADVLIPHGDGVVLRQADGAEIQISPRAMVAARDLAEGDVPLPQAYRFGAFSPDGNGFSAEARAEALELRLRLSWEAGAGFTMDISARPLQRTWVRQLSVELDIDADSALLLGRDLRPLLLESAAVLGRLDPKWATLYRKGRPVMTLVVSDDADGMQVRRNGGRLRVRVDLLAVEARPFFHFAACTENWKDPNQRLVLPVRLLEKGEVQGARVSIYAGSSTPLIKSRFPNGRRAALVITDHADQTAAPTLRALAGGTSDTSDPQWGRGGLLGYGLPITKALWLKSGERDPAAQARGGGDKAQGGQKSEGAVAPAPAAPGQGQQDSELDLLEQLDHGQADDNGGGRPQLDDPQVVSLADRLFAAGWEVIPHSATPMRDSRDLTQKALAFFRRFSAVSWIDHQPYTNCEALVNQGYRAGRYGITDLLKEHGYRYAWAGLDAPPGDLNLLLPRRLDRYVPVIWPVGRLAAGTPEGLWLFRSMLAFIEAQRLFEMYSTEALDRLERERGLHIAHTYLENFHPPSTWFGRRNLMVPGTRPREIVLDPRLDALLAPLAARVARGTLWVPTISRLGDHLRDLAGVSVTLETDGSATLLSRAAVSGATFVVPRPLLQVRVDDRPPKGLRAGDGETSFWVDLPAGRPVHVRLRSGTGQPVSFLQAPAPPPATIIGRTP